MSVTTTPNMSLPVPVVGQEDGPQYATDINSCFTLLDQHNHTAGSGVQITPDGLNINATLAFGNNFAINLAGISLTAQGSMPAINTVYESGTDLYFVDGLGNNVRLTQAGAVAGTPGSIANLVPPATATYVSGSSTFVWQSNASIAANMDIGSIILRNISPNSTFSVTLAPPAALTSNSTITLPALPGSTSLMALDSSGNISAPYTISGGLNASVLTPQSITATQIANSTITATQIATNTIATANYADGSVTSAKMAATNAQLSAQSGTFTFTGTVTLIPGLSSTLTTTGRPVMVMLMGGDLQVTSGNVTVALLRDGTPIVSYNVAGNINLPTSMIAFVDTGASAASHSYTISGQLGTSSGQMSNTSLYVYEIK